MTSSAATRADNRTARTSARSILTELWVSRDLVAQFVFRDVAIRYTQAVMGFGWALLMPVLIVGAGLVFRLAVSTLTQTPLQGSSVASLAAKALPWAFFSGAISIATQSILAHANLIGKIYFPRESLPIASVIAQCLDLVVGFTFLLIVLPFLDVRFSLGSLTVLLPLLLLVIFTMGMALILSCANLFFRDVKYIVQVVLSFGIFGTPVFFEPQMLGPNGARVMMALPLSPFIQAMDLTLVHGHNLLHPLIVTTPAGAAQIWAPWMLLYATILSIVTFVVGLRIFRSASSRFAEMA